MVVLGFVDQVPRHWEQQTHSLLFRPKLAGIQMRWMGFRLRHGPQFDSDVFVSWKRESHPVSTKLFFDVERSNLIRTPHLSLVHIMGT